MISAYAEDKLRKAALERDDYRCMAAVVRQCPGQAHHAHHRKLRPHCTDAERHDLANLVSVCVLCHEWIHKHFPEAEALGLRISAYAPIEPFSRVR